MRWQCKHCPIYTESHFSRLSTNYSKLSHLRALPAWWCYLPLLVVNRNVEINLWGASMENSLLTNRSSLPSRVAKLNLNINCWIIKLWKREKDRQEVRAWNKIHSWHFYISLLFFYFSFIFWETFFTSVEHANHPRFTCRGLNGWHGFPFDGSQEISSSVKLPPIWFKVIGTCSLAWILCANNLARLTNNLCFHQNYQTFLDKCRISMSLHLWKQSQKNCD